MAKYDEPFEDTQELYDQLLAQTGVGENINVRVLANNKAKEIFKVSKCSETEKFKTGDDVNIFLNETIFDQLELEQKLIIVEESLACIHYDSENSKMVISKPDVVSFSGILHKFSFEVWNAVRESVKSLYEKEKKAEDERAATTEKGKKKPF